MKSLLLGLREDFYDSIIYNEQWTRSGDLAEVKAIIRHAIYTNSMNYLRTTYTYLHSWGWGDKMPPLHYAHILFIDIITVRRQT